MTTQELITIYKSLPKTGVKTECKIEGHNNDYIVIRCREEVVCEGSSKSRNGIGPRKDQLLLSFLSFNLNIRLEIQFNKIRNIWGDETDSKYDLVRNMLSTDDSLKIALETLVLYKFEEIVPVLVNKEYYLFKNLFYRWRGLIGFSILEL